MLELRRGRGRVYALRFRAYGKRRYLTLGTSDEGCTRQRAEEAPYRTPSATFAAAPGARPSRSP